MRTNEWINTLDNQGVRAQLLFAPSDKIDVTASIDYAKQDPNGYAQVLAGVAPTLRPGYRQFNAIVADLGYTPVSLNPFDRITDTDTPWRSQSDLGGASVNVDVELGKGKLTSTTAWRFWTWDPVERPRLHRPAGAHAVAGHVEAGSMVAGGPLVG